MRKGTFTTAVLILLLIVGFVSAIQAQTHQITGKVTAAEDGQSLPGVTILVKDTTNIGASTDAKGTYSLEVPDDKNVLVFSFVGYKREEVKIGNRSKINVELQEDIRQLEDIVVVGYGIQTQRNVTGSISTVRSTDFETSPVVDLQQSLQGLAAGVNVTQGSGKLGQGIDVEVRGKSSISASTQPLYVVDGMPIVTDNLNTISGTGKTSPLASMSMGDIESISVLKGASATAIYGSRGSSGVVLIETKSGQAGETKYSVSYQISSRSPTNKLDMMDAEQYAEFQRMSYVGGAEYAYRINPNNWDSKQDAIDSYLVDYKNFMNLISSGNNWQQNPTNYNWQDRAFQNKLSHDLYVSASGGNENTTFYVGGGYSDQFGILVSNAYKKINGRLNIQNNPTDKIKLNLRLSLNKAINHHVANDGSFGTPIQAIHEPAVVPFYEDGDSHEPNLNTLFPNIIYAAEKGKRESNILQNVGNANVSFDIMRNLTFNSRFGLDLNTVNADTYFPPELSYTTGQHGEGYDGWTQLRNYTVQNTLNYENNIGSNQNLKILLGTEYNWVNRTHTSTRGTNFPSKDFENLENASTINSGTSSDEKYRFLSYFTRVNYDVKDRYLFKLSMRTDGSSRFGKDNRFGFFPAGSAGWIMSNENFLDNVEFVNLLKIRAGYGITGNADIGNYSARGLYGGVSYGDSPALTQTQVENPNLTWETTNEFNAGIDFGIFNNRLRGTIDFYHKRTKDLLLNVDVPGTSGFSTQLRNVGRITNKGVEVSINSDNLRGQFSWNSKFNISFNRNKVNDLGGQIIKVQHQSNRYVNRAMKGEPIGIFYTREYAGVNPENGDALFYVNHEPSNKELSSDDAFKVNDRFENRYVTTDHNIASAVKVGNPAPKFTGGLGNTFAYKGLSLDMFWQFKYGNKVYNANYFVFGYGLDGHPMIADGLKAWQESGDITDYPQARHGFNNGNSDRSSRNLYDGSYLRLKTLKLSYSLPKNYLNNLGLNSLNLFVQGTNLLTFTKYPGFSPELNTDYGEDDQLNIGNAFYTAPQARTISGGVSIDF